MVKSNIFSLTIGLKKKNQALFSSLVGGYTAADAGIRCPHVVTWEGDQHSRGGESVSWLLLGQTSAEHREQVREQDCPSIYPSIHPFFKSTAVNSCSRLTQIILLIHSFIHSSKLLQMLNDAERSENNTFLHLLLRQTIAEHHQKVFIFIFENEI